MNGNTKPCRCRGMNENCMYCFGSGVVARDISLSQQMLTGAGRDGTVSPTKVLAAEAKADYEKRLELERKQNLFILQPLKLKPDVTKTRKKKGKRKNQVGHNTQVVQETPLKRSSLSRKKKKRRQALYEPKYRDAIGAIDAEYPQDMLERNLDETKDYAHSFRENGRFGSHPSHDGFGDDSEP